MFATAESRKLAGVQQAIADIAAELPAADRAWKALAYEALAGDEEQRAKALEAKAVYTELLARREFAVAAAEDLQSQIEERERRKHDKQRRADRRALAAHLGNFRGALERVIDRQVEAQGEFDAAMAAAQKACALLPPAVRSELGNELSIAAVRGLMQASAMQIAQDLATVSPLPDPNVLTRLTEFTDWRTGQPRLILTHVESVIAGVKALSFPEYEPAATSRVAAVEGGAVAAPAAPPALLPPAGTPERPSQIWRVSDFQRLPDDEPEPEEELEPLPEEEGLPEFTRRRLTAEEEERLIAEASI
jgi:hypothetical protein